MAGDQAKGTGVLARVNHVVGVATTSAIAIAVILLTGVGVVAVIGRNGSAATWSRWSSVGQAFGVLSSVFSGLAVAVLVVTSWIQIQEIRKQRTEVAAWQASLQRTQGELYRSAEADLRKLHVELVKMAIQDDELATVWPSFGPEIGVARNRQYLYANLLLQHTRLQVRVGDIGPAQMQTSLRYLFKNPIMRRYWKDTADSRSGILVPGTPEYVFDHEADKICREYDAVLYCATSQFPSGSDAAGCGGDTGGPEGPESSAQAA
jgi:hypothetical protein